MCAEYRIEELRIDTASPLGEGGAAELHRCTTPDGAAMVIKRYNEDARANLDVEALRRLIQWPATLGPADRQRLMSICAWPQAVVVEDGSVIGVVMPVAPAKFFLHRKGKLEPCHFTRIAVRQDDAQKRGYPYFDFPHKIARLGHLLSELEFLHSKGIVIGDLQPNNILTTAPQPDNTGNLSTENYLVDCDSFIVEGRPAFPPMDPMSTRPPYNYDGFSATTDLYKFALLVIRCLSEHLAADAIHFDKYTRILPRADFLKLEKLLTSPAPGLTSAGLGNLARAWQSSVKPDGRMYRRTDDSLRERWTQDMRHAHLAGLASPTRYTPAPARNKPALRTPAESKVGKRSAATRFSGDARIIAAAVAALIVVALIVIGVTSAIGANTVNHAGRVIRSAKVGDCIHWATGAANGDGTFEAALVEDARCGTTYATDQVIRVTDNTANCSSWVRDTSLSPPVVLCLVRV
jgi:hypothetical protein